VADGGSLSYNERRLFHLEQEMSTLRNDLSRIEAVATRAADVGDENSKSLGVITESLATITGWLQGSTSKEGVMTKGIMAKVDSLIGSRGWFITIGTAIAVATGGDFVIRLFHTIYPVSRGH
jgi:hypothetical protein